MGIVQTALAKLLGPAVAPLADRIATLEARPGLSAADQETLAKAAAMVAEFEALAEGSIEVPDTGGSITVTDVTP